MVDALVGAGVLERTDLKLRPVIATPDPAHAVSALNPEQAAAARQIGARVRDDAFSVTLLDGVTGSGKTEVYFEAVAQALEQGRQALVLLRKSR